MVLFCLNSCHSNSDKTGSNGNAPNGDTLKIIQSIEKQCHEASKLYKSCKKLFASSNTLDTGCLKLELLVKNNMPVKLYYTYCDSATGLAQIFFLNRCTVSILKMEDHDSVVSVFFGDHKALFYDKTNGVISHLSMDRKNLLFHEANMARELSSDMSFFPSFKYNKLKPWPDTDLPTAMTISKIPLRTSPNKNSKIIQTLTNESSLFYLEPSNKLDTIGTRIWIWYKVRTDSGKIGWVFGHPDFIEDWHDGD